MPSHRIQAASAARVIEVRDEVARTTELEALRGGRIAVEGTELVVVLDSATWRHDIATWRWRESATAPAGWDDPDLEDSAWRVVPVLHPVISARANAPSWFRTRVTLPAEAAGSSISIVLGGLDGQDWDAYDARLDGVPLDAWRGEGAIREPHRIALAPGDPRLRFGEPMLLAVRCEGLSRSHPWMVAGEREHHYFQDWLVDQYVALGEPTMTVDDFRVTGIRVGEEGRRLELDLVSVRAPDLAATLRYRADGEIVSKSVTLRNEGREPLSVLDVVGDRWLGKIEPSVGGRGQPVLVGDLFAGIEHPAGVARVAPGRVELVEMPGVRIEPGAAWSSHDLVLGGRDPEGVEPAVRRYIMGLRERPADRMRVYSSLGWYDFTNPADPLPELTADLVRENLDQLRELRDAGGHFDVYMFDDWWDWQDLGRFRRSTFPDGPAASVEGVEALGMRAGLWWATSRTAWTANERPGLDAASANAPGFGEVIELAGGEWRWLEEFTNVMVGERRLCLAAEPYRSHFLEALPAVVRETRAALLKLDCAVLHCTSSDHGHRPGRHSMQPMVEALVELIARCRAASEDLRVVLYWGTRSPWFLRHVDALFDKGLLMEAATVASTPAPSIRQSLSTNVDQAIRHARFLPLRLQDSLGVWVGDVAWCNRIGAEEWQEAFLLDIARGSDLVQLWGDLTLFDEPDRRFLADVTAWLEDAGIRSHEPTRLGGDPWMLEPYGYASRHGDRVTVTLANPSVHAGTVKLPADLAEGTRGAVWWELYPFPGRVPGAGPGPTLGLAPFEVRVVELRASGPREDQVPLQRRPGVRTTRTLELDIPVLERSVGQPSVAWSTEVHLPRLENGDLILVSQRLERDGQWAYHPDTRSVLDLEARLDGLAARLDSLPRIRDRNGPGSPWALRRIPAGAAWSGRTLTLDLVSRVPPGTRVHTQAHVVDAWWRQRRRFERPHRG